MELLQLREEEIFETLKRIKDFRFVIIGGYAVNAYTLARFSVDCDIVVEGYSKLRKISKELKNLGYNKKDIIRLKLPYGGNFVRYEKKIKENFKVSFDILIEEVLDRQTNAIFTAEWIFKNSKIRELKGKTITEELKLRIINPDALIVMKSISCRTDDIRDVFMLITQVKNIDWIKEEIQKRYDFKDRVSKIKEKVNSKQFKDNLQGIYGYIDESIFKKHLLEINRLDSNIS